MIQFMKLRIQEASRLSCLFAQPIFFLSGIIGYCFTCLNDVSSIAIIVHVNVIVHIGIKRAST